MKLSNRIKELIFETRNNNFPNRYLRNIEEFEYDFFIKNILDENFVFN